MRFAVAACGLALLPFSLAAGATVEMAYWSYAEIEGVAGDEVWMKYDWSFSAGRRLNLFLDHHAPGSIRRGMFFSMGIEAESRLHASVFDARTLGPEVRIFSNGTATQENNWRFEKPATARLFYIATMPFHFQSEIRAGQPRVHFEFGTSPILSIAHFGGAAAVQGNGAHAESGGEHVVEVTRGFEGIAYDGTTPSKKLGGVEIAGPSGELYRCPGWPETCSLGKVLGLEGGPGAWSVRVGAGAGTSEEGPMKIMWADVPEYEP